MPDVTVRALVLRRLDSGESDRRLTLLTEELGKLDVIARGARKSGSRLAGASEPGMLATVTFASGRNRRFVTQVQPVTSFPKLRFDYDRLASAFAFLEFLHAVLPYESRDERLFQAAVKGMAAIESSERPIVALCQRLVKILESEGQGLQLEACVDTSDRVKPDQTIYISPTAGGVVSAQSAASYPDAFRVPPQLFQLFRQVAHGDCPDAAEEAIGPLYRVVRHMTGTPLPALRQVVESVFRHDSPEITL